jgi:hypothetical protein
VEQSGARRGMKLDDERNRWEVGDERQSCARSGQKERGGIRLSCIAKSHCKRCLQRVYSRSVGFATMPISNTCCICILHLPETVGSRHFLLHCAFSNPTAILPHLACHQPSLPHLACQPPSPPHLAIVRARGWRSAWCGGR